MLVYSDYKECTETEEMLLHIEQTAEYLSIRADYDTAVELLTECGNLETALTDQFCAKTELINPLICSSRQLTLAAGWIFSRCCRNESMERKAVQRVMGLVQKLKSFPLPGRISYAVPEGFAFYGLYPECYICSAEKFLRKYSPKEVVCIGLRSIGTTLSAVVASRLQQRGVETVSFTVRPRGHPFDRLVELGGELIGAVSSDLSRFFLLVDEGPGLSGSSLCGAARLLEQLGVPRRSVLMFPSWIPSGAQLVSQAAKRVWSDYEKICTDFEEIKGDIGVFRSYSGCIDISAGRWREVLCGPRHEYPAVNPYHERRKFLVRAENGNCFTKMLKFAGLGKPGRETEVFAKVLGEGGFAPKALDYCEGFLQYEFKQGDVQRFGDADDDFLGRVAEYLVFRKEVLPVKGEAVSFDKMKEMIRINLEESVGRSFADTFSLKSLISEEMYYQDVSNVDGKMLPCKWVNSQGSWYKFDGTDHHRDQFLPGVQNSAWDAAGFCIEFGLSGNQKKKFLRMYGERMADAFLEKRMPFYFVAYSAFRAGYASMAAHSLGNSPDGIRFRRMYDYYRETMTEQLRKAKSKIHVF
ncbi:MAG: hypothetical protein ACLFQB_01855 [Chitinispirillaceae bacterium]